MPNIILENSATSSLQEFQSSLLTATLLPTTGFITLCTLTLPVGTWDLIGRMSVTGVNGNGTINLYIGSTGNGEEIACSLTMRTGVAAESGVSGTTRITVTAGTITCSMRTSNFSTGFGAVSALPYNSATGSGTFLLAKQAVGVAGATLRILNAANLLTNPILQTSLQAAYDNQLGLIAPDLVMPLAVTNAANALANTNYKLYLGHNNWYYQNAIAVTAGSLWTPFNSKNSFNALVPANHIFTFK